ncbi:MAG: hypothetical protein R3Y29_07090 [bacterium]
MTEYDSSFNSLYDFVECIERGCEVEFKYYNKKYSITRIKNNKLLICEFYNEDSEKVYNNARGLLGYKLRNKPLKDLIPSLKIMSRSF